MTLNEPIRVVGDTTETLRGTRLTIRELLFMFQLALEPVEM
jgi:hypothetical protein